MIFASFFLSSATQQNPPILSFDEGYTHLFGDSNLMLHRDGKTVHISLDERTGAGFVSQDIYLHGFFSASIKLPADYTAGVVVAFYMSNGDIYKKIHDELDFEFLGNIRGKQWRVQTNVYCNGSTGIGREERYGLWFDPTEDFHQYSILWTDHQIIFFVDNIPIREFKRIEAPGGDFPSKPMSLYATIWDASSWATSGGRYKVNYKYAPYTAEFADLVLHGCTVNPIDLSPKCNNHHSQTLSMSFGISSDQKSKMREFRKKHMTYSYCYDGTRYSTPPPECVINRQEAELMRGSSGNKFGTHHRRSKRHRRNSPGEASTI